MIVAATLAVLADLIVLAAAPGAGHPAAPPLKVGAKVPDIVLTELDGRSVKLSDLGRRTPSGIVSLTFWCTFCHSEEAVKSLLAGRDVATRETPLQG